MENLLKTKITILQLILFVGLITGCSVLKKCFFDGGDSDTMISYSKDIGVMYKDYTVYKKFDPIHESDPRFKEQICLHPSTTLDLKGRQSGIDVVGLVDNIDGLTNKQNRLAKETTRRVMRNLNDAFWAGLARRADHLRKFRLPPEYREEVERAALLESEFNEKIELQRLNEKLAQ